MDLKIKKQELKFIVSAELGRLVRWLRILGYDTAYLDSAEKRELIIKSLREERIILTCNIKLKTTEKFNIIYIKSESIFEQLNQLMRDLKLKLDSEKLFSRCLICNTILQEINKDKIKSKIPPYVFNTQSQFKLCPNCRKIYWPGTHWENARVYLSKVNPARDG